MDIIGRLLMLAKIKRIFRLVLAMAMTAVLIFGTIHADTDLAFDPDQTAAAVWAQDQGVTGDVQAVLPVSHDAACPSQTFCHSPQALNAALEVAVQPANGDSQRLYPEVISGRSRTAALDIRPPIV